MGDECSCRCNDGRVTEPQYRGRRWAVVRAHVLERDGWVCQVCFESIDRYARPRTSRAAVVDHIRPCSDGGDWYDPTNLRAAHHACNTVRANRGRSPQRAPYPLPRDW